MMAVIGNGLFLVDTLLSQNFYNANTSLYKRAFLDKFHPSVQVNEEPSFEAKVRESSSASDEEIVPSPRGLRRRILPPSEYRSPTTIEDSNNWKSAKLDAAAHAHTDKHRENDVLRPHGWF